VSNARRLHLIRDRWHRYLWLSMRQNVRRLDRELRTWRSPTYCRLLMLNIDQSWRYLGLVP
jgi:hypothetical protein